jgi:hypothetical protein
MYVFSSEVRWFFPGVIGTDHRLLTWFKKPLTGDGRLELTRIFVDNNRQNPRNAWFTICFEAFAPKIARTRTVLDSCARLALDELGLPPDADLDERTSLSYTGWFGTLEGR